MKNVLAVLVLLATSCCFAQSSSQSNQPPAPPKTTYILAGRLFDATSDSIRETIVIAVEGDRIKNVAPAASIKIPAGASVLDLSHSTVLPGLIDCHTHLQSRADRYNDIYRFRDTPFTAAFFAVGNARRTLEAGFTTVRDVGSKPFLAVDLRNAINDGFVWAHGSWPVDPRFPLPAVTVTSTVFRHRPKSGCSPRNAISRLPTESIRSASGSSTGEIWRRCDQDSCHRRCPLERR
jgi:amidohydrolase family protein